MVGGIHCTKKQHARGPHSEEKEAGTRVCAREYGEVPLIGADNPDLVMKTELFFLGYLRLKERAVWLQEN